MLADLNDRADPGEDGNRRKDNPDDHQEYRIQLRADEVAFTLV